MTYDKICEYIVSQARERLEEMFEIDVWDDGTSEGIHAGCMHWLASSDEDDVRSDIEGTVNELVDVTAEQWDTFESVPRK